jgi:acetyl esterase/lipase
MLVAWALWMTMVGGFELQPGKAVAIWPEGMPAGRADKGPETESQNPRPGQVSVTITGNVSNPTLTLYPAPKDKATGAAVMVCPGGGYNILASNLEGTEICEWLNDIGVTAIVLKYRVPTPKENRYEAPLQDAQRGLGLIRSQAKELGLDPSRIGIIGFSAGGHLSANLCAHNGERSYASIDAADAVSCRPDFAMLIYPAYLLRAGQDAALAPEIVVSHETPPTFVTMTMDDPINVMNALTYGAALAKARVPSEVHVFPTGGHGYGLRPSKNEVWHWPVLATAWMRANGWLSAPEK